MQRTAQTTQVPLAGEVQTGDIPREFFYEGGKRIITEEMLLTAGYLAYNDHPFGFIVDFQDVKDAAVPGDIVFIDKGAKGNVKPGQRYYVYGRDVEVSNPHTGEEWGYIVRIIGLIEIVDVGKDKEVSTAKVLKAYGMIFKGNSVMPEFKIIAPKLDPDRPVDDKQISATIMAVNFGKGGVSGDDIVYIDAGRSKGIEEGDVFSISEVHEEDGELTSGKHGIEKKVGKMRIVLVRGDTATAIVTESKSEIKVGDKASFVQER